MAFEVKMPQLGLTMEEGTVTKWVKQEGDTVKAGDVILEITTDKLTSEVESEHDGVLLKIVAQEGEDIPVKGLLAYIGEAGEQVGDAPAAKAEAPAAEAVAPVPAAAPAAPVAPVAGGRIRISPLAKKTAAKLGVDYTTVAGSALWAESCRRIFWRQQKLQKPHLRPQHRRQQKRQHRRKPHWN